MLLQGPTTFDGRLMSSFSAHPKLDPQTRELVYFGYSLVARPYLSYGVISKEREIVHQADIDLPNPVMVRYLTWPVLRLGLITTGY